MRIARTGRSCLLLVAGTLAALASMGAVAAAVPVNDNYLASLRINDPGTRIDRSHTLSDQRDTSDATVQADVLNPPRSGGPAELTTCGPASYGKTVWYDFYPDVSGTVRVRASGYDTVIALMPFSRATLLPDFQAGVCINDAGPQATEELLASVRRGRSYTIQVGGVGTAGGALALAFDFLADRDADGVFDTQDQCPNLAGPTSRDGCPPRISADPTLRVKLLPDGIEVVGLRVSATRGARVRVRCSSGCPTQVRTARTVSFPRLRGARLRAGATLTITATRRRAIGAYIQYRVRAGSFRKVRRCLDPGSRKPRRRCG